jgi:CRP-like cAMP-binding protein
VQADPDRLAAIPLLSELSSSELQQVARWTEVRHADAGDRLVGEGAAGYSFFVIEDGHAAVTSEGNDLGTLGEGDFFGEIAILGEGGRRTATVTATSPVTYLAIFGSDSRQLERELPSAAARIRQAMAQRLDGADDAS